MKVDVDKLGQEAMAQMMPRVTAGMQFLASKMRAAAPRSRKPKPRGHMADNITVKFKQNAKSITAIVQIPFPARFLEFGARWPAKNTGKANTWHTKPRYFVRETMIRNWNAFVDIVKG